MYFKNKLQQDQLIIEEDLFFRVKINLSFVLLILLLQGLQEKVGDPLRIDAYLIKPVQRMTKYRQFLEVRIILISIVFITIFNDYYKSHIF